MRTTMPWRFLTALGVGIVVVLGALTAAMPTPAKMVYTEPTPTNRVVVGFAFADAAGPAVARIHVDPVQIKRMGPGRWQESAVREIEQAWAYSALPGPKRAELRGHGSLPTDREPAAGLKVRLEGLGYTVTAVVIPNCVAQPESAH